MNDTIVCPVCGKHMFAEKNDYDICLRDTFNVAFIGVMCNHKGGNVLKKLLSKKLDAKIHFHVFGSSELPELCKNQKNYTYHGRYQRSELSNLLKKNEINLICFFQIWPETYSYTLNEAVAAGIPVLSFDIGAGAERVKKHHLGWVIDVNSSVNQIVKKLDEIASNKEEYNTTEFSITDEGYISDVDDYIALNDEKVKGDSLIILDTNYFIIQDGTQ